MLHIVRLCIDSVLHRPWNDIYIKCIVFFVKWYGGVYCNSAECVRLNYCPFSWCCCCFSSPSLRSWALWWLHLGRCISWLDWLLRLLCLSVTVCRVACIRFGKAQLACNTVLIVQLQTGELWTEQIIQYNRHQNEFIFILVSVTRQKREWFQGSWVVSLISDWQLGFFFSCRQEFLCLD